MEEQDVCNYNVTLIERGFYALSTMDGAFLFSLDFFRFLSELFPMMKGNLRTILKYHKSGRICINDFYKNIDFTGNSFS